MCYIYNIYTYDYRWIFIYVHISDSLFKSPWFPNLFREEILDDPFPDPKSLKLTHQVNPRKVTDSPRNWSMPWHLVPYKASTPSLERPKSVSTACASSSRTTFLIVKFFCDQRTLHILRKWTLRKAANGFQTWGDFKSRPILREW